MRGLILQSLRFGAVGMVNTAIGLAVIYALIFFFSARPAVANMCGYTVGLAASFALNRVWTFNSPRSVAQVLPKYLLLAGASYLLNLSAVIASPIYFTTNPYLAQLAGVGLYTICMFAGCRWFVFAPQRAVTGGSIL